MAWQNNAYQQQVPSEQVFGRISALALREVGDAFALASCKPGHYRTPKADHSTCRNNSILVLQRKVIPIPEVQAELRAMTYNTSFDASTSLDTVDEFAEALEKLQQDSDFLLDPEDGPAVAWSNIIQRQIEDLQGTSDTEQLEYLLLERNAWDLVQTLFASVWLLSFCPIMD